MRPPERLFVPERDDAWLESLWLRCCTLPFLNTLAEECRLADYFVGCNLVMNLADLFYNVLHNRNVRLTAGATTADVHAWLSAPAPGQGEQLVSPAARTELEQGPDQNDPWRRVNLWLGREVLARSLSGNVPTPAETYARETFEASFPAVAAGVPVCRERSLGARDAFTDWWKEMVQRLVGLWQGRLWPQRGADGLTHLAQLLGRELNHPPHWLTTLVQKKNADLQGCHGQLRRWGRLPVDQAWFNQMTSRLLAAAEAVEEVNWQGPDVENLRLLLNWLEGHGPGPGGHPWAATALWQRSSAGPGVPEEDVVAVGEEWNEVVGRANELQAGVPAGQLLPMAEDLFFFPSPAPFLPWVQLAKDYWPHQP
jgi:hypothetical protein